MAEEFVYIETDDALDAMVEACRRCDFVTIDTEFQRTDTYYPLVGLIQIFDGKTCYLVDPLSLNSLGPFADLLGDESVLKVLHACSEDLEVFDYAVGQAPVPVFDTQIAAAVLGVGFSMSYQNLVEHYMSITVPKEQTRSDWLRRPLSEAQLEYAALDVVHLFDVYRRQVADLEAEGRVSWIEEECSELGQEVATGVDPEAAYLRIKSAARMNPRELNLLRSICAWREQKARASNLPRNRVIDEKTVVGLVKNPPQMREALGHAGMTPRQIRKWGDEILDAVEAATNTPTEDWPELLPEARISISNEAIRALRSVVSACAEQHGIAPEILAKKRQLEELLRSGHRDDEYELPTSLLGWRRTIVGEPLLDALRAND